MNSLRSWLLRSAVLPAGDLFFGQNLMPRLRFLEKAQWWDRERLHAERDRRLQKLVRIAATEVPFYADLFRQACVDPGEIRSPEDLQRLPIVTKAMLREHYPHRTTRNTGLRTYEAKSSGSTGTPMFVQEDAETAGVYRAAFILELEWAGWRIGEPHLQTGMELQKRSLDRRLKDALLGCHLASARDLTDRHLDSLLEILEHRRLQHLWGYPGSLYHLARRAVKLGWNRSLRSVVTWGNTLHAHYRRALESTFRCGVYDTYGCSEGIQMAAQCGHGDSYHVLSLDTVVEILDDDGRPVAPGQPGHAILTRLHPGPMPLLRYRVGDIVVRGPEEPCPCGRALERLASIQGRDTDIILTPTGNRLLGEFFAGFLEFFGEIESFQVVQRELESIVLSIVPAPGVNPTPELASRITAELRSKGAGDLRIDVQFVPDIPLAPSGKRRFVINELAGRISLLPEQFASMPGTQARIL